MTGGLAQGMSALQLDMGLAAGLALALSAGAVMGSFAVAVAWRLPRGEDWVAGRSRCTACHTVLGPRDLVPLLSWLATGGRCRHCGTAIPACYPLTEALTAVAFAVPVMAHGGFWSAHLALWLLATLLAVLALVDLSHRYIPDGCTLGVAALGLALSLAGLSIPWKEGVLAALLLGGCTGLLRLGATRVLGREALGLGDVKLFAAAGLWVGLGGAGMLLLASALTGLLFHLIRRRQVEAGPEIPFGPCIALALYLLAVWFAPSAASGGS